MSVASFATEHDSSDQQAGGLYVPKDAPTFVATTKNDGIVLFDRHCTMALAAHYGNCEWKEGSKGKSRLRNEVKNAGGQVLLHTTRTKRTKKGKEKPLVDAKARIKAIRAAHTVNKRGGDHPGARPKTYMDAAGRIGPQALFGKRLGKKGGEITEKEVKDAVEKRLETLASTAESAGIDLWLILERRPRKESLLKEFEHVKWAHWRKQMLKEEFGRAEQERNEMRYGSAVYWEYVRDVATSWCAGKEWIHVQESEDRIEADDVFHDLCVASTDERIVVISEDSDFLRMAPQANIEVVVVSWVSAKTFVLPQPARLALCLLALAGNMDDRLSKATHTCAAALPTVRKLVGLRHVGAADDFEVIDLKNEPAEALFAALLRTCDAFKRAVQEDRDGYKREWSRGLVLHRLDGHQALDGEHAMLQYTKEGEWAAFDATMRSGSSAEQRLRLHASQLAAVFTDMPLVALDDVELTAILEASTYAYHTTKDGSVVLSRDGRLHVVLASQATHGRPTLPAPVRTGHRNSVYDDARAMAMVCVVCAAAAASGVPTQTAREWKDVAKAAEARICKANLLQRLRESLMAVMQALKDDKKEEVVRACATAVVSTTATFGVVDTEAAALVRDMANSDGEGMAERVADFCNQYGMQDEPLQDEDAKKEAEEVAGKAILDHERRARPVYIAAGVPLVKALSVDHVDQEVSQERTASTAEEVDEVVAAEFIIASKQIVSSKNEVDRAWLRYVGLIKSAKAHQAVFTDYLTAAEAMRATACTDEGTIEVVGSEQSDHAVAVARGFLDMFVEWNNNQDDVKPGNGSQSEWVLDEDEIVNFDELTDEELLLEGEQRYLEREHELDQAIRQRAGLKRKVAGFGADIEEAEAALLVNDKGKEALSLAQEAYAWLMSCFHALLHDHLEDALLFKQAAVQADLASANQPPRDDPLCIEDSVLCNQTLVRHLLVKLKDACVQHHATVALRPDWLWEGRETKAGEGIEATSVAADETVEVVEVVEEEDAEVVEEEDGEMVELEENVGDSVVFYLPVDETMAAIRTLYEKRRAALRPLITRASKDVLAMIKATVASRRAEAMLSAVIPEQITCKQLQETVGAALGEDMQKRFKFTLNANTSTRALSFGDGCGDQALAELAEEFRRRKQVWRKLIAGGSRVTGKDTVAWANLLASAGETAAEEEGVDPPERTQAKSFSYTRKLTVSSTLGVYLLQLTLQNAQECAELANNEWAKKWFEYARVCSRTKAQRSEIELTGWYSWMYARTTTHSPHGVPLNNRDDNDDAHSIQPTTVSGVTLRRRRFWAMLLQPVLSTKRNKELCALRALAVQPGMIGLCVNRLKTPGEVWNKKKVTLLEVFKGEYRRRSRWKKLLDAVEDTRAKATNSSPEGGSDGVGPEDDGSDEDGDDVDDDIEDFEDIEDDDIEDDEDDGVDGEDADGGDEKKRVKRTIRYFCLWYTARTVFADDKDGVENNYPTQLRHAVPTCKPLTGVFREGNIQRPPKGYEQLTVQLLEEMVISLRDPGARTDTTRLFVLAGQDVRRGTRLGKFVLGYSYASGRSSNSQIQAQQGRHAVNAHAQDDTIANTQGHRRATVRMKSQARTAENQEAKELGLFATIQGCRYQAAVLGNWTGRGMATVSKAARQLATLMPTFVINETGTTQRCSVCLRKADFHEFSGSYAPFGRRKVCKCGVPTEARSQKAHAYAAACLPASNVPFHRDTNSAHAIAVIFLSRVVCGSRPKAFSSSSATSSSATSSTARTKKKARTQSDSKKGHGTQRPGGDAVNMDGIEESNILQGRRTRNQAQMSYRGMCGDDEDSDDDDDYDDSDDDDDYDDNNGKE